MVYNLLKRKCPEITGSIRKENNDNGMFEDIVKILNYKGMVNTYKCQDKTVLLATKALFSMPLLKFRLKKAKGIIIKYTLRNQGDLKRLNKSFKSIKRNCNIEANILFFIEKNIAIEKEVIEIILTGIR